MPKPTFLQSVLKKPSRSYADPNASSPWAETPSRDERYSGVASNVRRRYAPSVRYDEYDGYDDEDEYVEPVAGPSRSRRQEGFAEYQATPAPRRSRSVVFVPEVQEQEFLPTRFPKAVKKAKSTVVLRDAQLVESYGSGVRTRSVSDKSVRKKKKKPVGSVNGDAASMMSGHSETSSRVSDLRELDHVSAATLLRPSRTVPTIQVAETPSTSSSISSSSRRPLSPVHEAHLSSSVGTVPTRPRPNVVQRIVAGGTAPITPPASDLSSARSSRERVHTANRERGDLVDQTDLSRRDTVKSSASAHTAPRDAPSGNADVQQTPSAPVKSPIPAEADQNPATPVSGVGSGLNGFTLAPPVLTLQPPTPAAVQETESSPFHAQAAEDYSTSQPRASGVAATLASAPAVFDDDDVGSESGEVGSDGDGDSAIQDGSAVGLQQQRNGPLQPSRPQPVAHAVSLPGPPSDYGSSRGSYAHHTPRSSLSQPDLLQRRSSAVPSEASFGGRSAREGSIRSGVSGFGKGGWAAAAASGSQSGRNTPVQMFVPSGANNGWADFQVPVPPPRQSRFTPLPPSSQPPSFERLQNGSSDVTSNSGRPKSRQSSVNGTGTSRKAISNAGIETFQRRTSGQPRGEGSQPSSYSQGSESEEDDLPIPSRSYASRPPTANGHVDSREGGYEPPNERDDASNEEWDNLRPSRKYSTGPVPPPKSPRRASVSPRLSAVPHMSNGQYLPARPNIDEAYKHDDYRSAAASESWQAAHIPNGHAEKPYHHHDTGDSPSQSACPARPSSPAFSRPGTSMSRPMSPTESIMDHGAFPQPSFLDPDVLTLLPEMTIEDSNELYRSPSVSANGVSRPKSALGRRKAPSIVGLPLGRPASALGHTFGHYANSEIAPNGDRFDYNIAVRERSVAPRRAKSTLGFNRDRDRANESRWEGSSYGEGVLMQSDGRAPDRAGGYSSAVIPAGAYVPSDPNRKRTSILDARILGLPQTTMATLTLSHSAHRLPTTPAHLRHNLPPPVDFTSHAKPPTKVGSKEVLVQVYAVAVDTTDVHAVEQKGKADVGKWIPGRSFVGRCLSVGGEEKEIVRGDIVIGLIDVRKSGVLAEYIVCDRRRLTRAPHPTNLTLEQLSLLPLHGIPAVRATRARLIRQSRALILDAHFGVAAVVCQAMSRAGVNVTAVIGGGEHHHDAQTRCLQNGARGVLTGNPAAVMLGLDEDGWDLVFDTKGGPKVYDAAKRMLKNGGKLVTTVEPDSSLPEPVRAAAKPSGFRTLRAALSGRRRDTKQISFEYLPPAGSGEPEVDSGGMDVRDILEEPGIYALRPVVESIWPFERGMEAFGAAGMTSVIRIIN